MYSDYCFFLGLLGLKSSSSSSFFRTFKSVTTPSLYEGYALFLCAVNFKTPIPRGGRCVCVCDPSHHRREWCWSWVNRCGPWNASNFTSDDHQQQPEITELFFGWGEDWQHQHSAGAFQRARERSSANRLRLGITPPYIEQILASQRTGRPNWAELSRYAKPSWPNTGDCRRGEIWILNNL